MASPSCPPTSRAAESQIHHILGIAGFNQTEICSSQPAISKHVADLERALGLKLVERTRRDGALTSAGDFVANYVLRAEALLAQAALGAAQFRDSGSGTIAIVASWVTGTYLLPEIIAEFQHLHPGVRISLELGTAVKAVDWLRSHRAELGFIAGAAGGPEIESEPILDNKIIVVGSPALIPSPPSREDLRSLTWISREEGSAARAASDTAMGRLGIVAHRRLELPSYEAVVHALTKGYGVAALSHFVVAPELRAGSLVVVPVTGWNVSSMISVLRVRDALLTPAADQFQALVRKRFGELPSNP
ncbi:MAG TPA: LysR family transcriptional regulator [Stellaceae bacterium]|nr:LysR family transcriptional regulator [Stellaceae bacterium]